MLLVLFTALALPTAAIAKDARLITPVPAKFTSVEGAPEPVGERASRVGQLDVDLNQLYLIGNDEEPAEVPIPGRSLEIELFPGEVYSLTGVKSTQFGSVWSWGATVDEIEGGEVMLTIDGESVYGTVNTTEHSFTILPDANGQIWVRENDPFQILEDEVVPTPVGDRSPLRDTAPLAPRTGGSDSLDVALLYTAAASSS